MNSFETMRELNALELDQVAGGDCCTDDGPCDCNSQLLDCATPAYNPNGSNGQPYWTGAGLFVGGHPIFQFNPQTTFPPPPRHK